MTDAEPLEEPIRLLQRFFAEEGFATPAETVAQRVRHMAALDSCAIVVAEAEGSAIGVATVSLEYGIEYGWSAEMGDLYVLPAWRGRGVARRLIGEVEEFLRSRGATGYQVTVTPQAQSSHGLDRVYKAMGFADEGRSILYKVL